jgi:biotin carboxyl carrier protein
MGALEEVTEAESAQPPSVEQSIKDTTYVISAQRVGFFFPEVKPGDRIFSGNLVGQVKAMNINHEIRSAIDGEVESICVESGAGVAFGDPLLKLVEE